jgi:hypothetical protein
VPAKRRASYAQLKLANDNSAGFYVLGNYGLRADHRAIANRYVS